MFTSVVLLGAILLQPSPAGARPVDLASLLHEMIDLDRLGHQPSPAYSTVQLSSFDRRSQTRDDPHWYANGDGFGREPTPGFLQVLREPDQSGTGLYLVADEKGPGAIVRGWSAGMAGVLRVYLDGASEPLFLGTGYDFFARRSRHFEAMSASTDWTGRDPFVQEDADYLPIPYASGMRITWEGRTAELHFYHLQVRRYVAGSAVKSFDAATLPEHVKSLTDELARRRDDQPSGDNTWQIDLEPGGEMELRLDPGGSRQISFLSLRLTGEDREAALRGTLLRIHFDRSQEPQIDSPAGDFFGSGIGVNAFDAIPMTVRYDGTMVCRYVMPFRESARIVLLNLSGQPVSGLASVALAPHDWSESSLYFHAKWRVDHELRAEGGGAPYDLPHLVALGSGRLVGAACMLMNPLPSPHRNGNWWGEGDEKILIDGEKRPSTFGTGSEDFYNYSWSRPALFDHAYCGQPLDSGPDNCGYVSNHRFFVLDDIPFQSSAAFLVEMWSHVAVEPLSYGRIVWWYARPGAIDDHRRLQPAELVIPPIPGWKDGVWSEDGQPTCRPAAQLGARSSRGAIEEVDCKLSRSGSLLSWRAEIAEKLTLTLSASEEGQHEVYMVALYTHDGPIIRALFDGQLLQCKGQPSLVMRAVSRPRLLGCAFDPVSVKPGQHQLVLEAISPGQLSLDYVALRLRGRPPIQVAGAQEGERMEVLVTSQGLEYELQKMRADSWSGGAHLWVKATQPRAFIELKCRPPEPGLYQVGLRLTRSWDYGQLAVSLDGERTLEQVETFNTSGEGVGLLPEIDLGRFVLGEEVTLRLETVGHHPESKAPFYYFGVDCLVLTPVKD